MKGKTFDGKDGLLTPIDPSSSKATSDDSVLEPKHEIFLSHSGAQKGFVDQLCKDLEDHGYQPFFDRRSDSLPKGENFPSLIFKAAQQCQLFVVVISDEYFMSKWPMIELSAFVKSKKELKSTFGRGLLPLFYGLSMSELEDERRRLRWFERWETFAKADCRGLIKVDDWKYALDVLTMFNGLQYDRELKQVVEYENEIVSHICKLVVPDIELENVHVQGHVHEVVIEKVKHKAIAISSHSLFGEVVKSKTFDGKDGLLTPIDPSSSKATSDDPVLEPKHKIFLSHSGAQKEFVDHLCKDLEDHGYQPFFDRRPDSLPKGENFPSLIFKAAQQCQLFVVVISDEYFMSKWPMIELSAFVKSMKELKSTFGQGLLPLFYGLSVSELEDERRRLRWFERWETFAKADCRGLINLGDWKYALDVLTMTNGLQYDRELKQIVKYENEIVSHICKVVVLDIKSSEATSDDPVLEPKHKIFLSHSGAQKEFVDHLCKALEDRGYQPFFDRCFDSLPVGENFPSLIFKAAQQCQLFVVVISDEYFMSKWPMIELSAFVKSKKELKSTFGRGLLPLFYGLSVSELEDERRRLRWFERWETFAKADCRGLIKVDDWKYALDVLTMFNGLQYDREWKQVVEYENEIVFQISRLVTPDMSSLLREAVTELARLWDTSLLTFPEGDPDPVRIKDKDLQSLQPKRHLSISIIDFYMMYLQKEVLFFKDKDPFFFFNCSFFISTFGTKISATGIDCEQVRQWTRGVNLFEKDYIFIPVHKKYSILWICTGLSGSHICGKRILNASEHWSLIIIHHLSSLTGSPADVHYHPPCIFHLYSVEGKHEDLEGDIRGFIFKSWTEIHQNSDILQALFRMKYVEAKIPEDNGYDSGIYLLHYMERFILESESPDFSFGTELRTEQGKSRFPDWDTSVVVTKRKHIQNLISKLGRMTLLQGTPRLHSSVIYSWPRVKAASEARIKDVENSDLTMVNGKGAESEHGGHQTGGVTVLNEHQPFDVSESLRFFEDNILRQEHEASRLTEIEEISQPRQAEESLLQAVIDTPILRKEGEKRRSRKFNWSAVETSVLLRCLDSFSQGNNAWRWDSIAGEVNRVCGTTHTSNQCRYRFDTLSKAFKQVDEYCRTNAKEFSEITEKERREIKLATTLTKEWYTLMAQHYTYRVNHRNGGKRPSDYPTSSAAEIQIEAPADCPSSPRIDTDKLPSSCACELQSEILPESPPARPINRHDGTPVPESSLTTDPRPLIQGRKSRSDEDEMKGVYRRAVKDMDGRLLRFRYEPRFKAPRDVNSLGEPGTYNMLSLGSYGTPQDAKDMRQIAAYYYGRGDAWLDLGNGNHFRIPDCDPVELQSLSGKDKRIWVQRIAKEVFADFQMEKARLDLLRKEERLSPASSNPGPFMAT